MAEQNKKMSEYCSYIRSVYQKVHKEQKMSQEEFGRKVIRFKSVQNGRVIRLKGYTRNSVGNWIEGKNYPEYKESLVCIALMDYCGNTDSAPFLTEEERNQRLAYVNEILWKYLGKSLYARNLTETALFHAARGIISMEDIPQLVKEVFPEAHKLPPGEMREIALRNETERFLIKNSEAEDAEAVKQLLLANKSYYALGYKTLGYRIQHSFEKRHPNISFKHAILIHAPRFQNTYRKMMDDDLQVTRDFIIHFCAQMGMNKDEINYALKTAQMKQLEEEIVGPDYYKELHDMAFAKKLGWLVYLASYLERCSTDDLQSMKMLPVYSYLNHYMLLDSTEKYYKEMEALLRKDNFSFVNHIRASEYSWMEDLREYIHMTCMEIETWKEEEQDYYWEYCDSFQRMYQPASKKMNQVPKSIRRSVELLYVLAAFSYTIFLEKEFDGELTKQDMTDLEMIIQKETSFNKEEKENIFFFFNHLWVIYLDAGELLADTNGYLYAMIGKPAVKTAAFQWEEGLESMIDCWALSLGLEI